MDGNSSDKALVVYEDANQNLNADTMIMVECPEADCRLGQGRAKWMFQGGCQGCRDAAGQ